jgi:hypothetical protein
MGAVATAFTAAFKTTANTDPADCQALGVTVESYVAAPRTHNANAAAAPTSAPTGVVRRAIGADGADASDAVDAFGGISTFFLRRANGTGASPTAVQSGDVIGRVLFGSYYTSGGAAYAAQTAGMRADATENHTSTAQGSRLAFQTTPNGASAPTITWVMGQDKSLKGLGPLGYDTGAGGTVTQATSKATGVALNKICGKITMNAAALAAGTIVSFVLTNSFIAAGDVLILNHVAGGTPGSYSLNARCGAGSATIDVRNNTAGSLGEAIEIAFVLIKAVTS